MSERKEPMENLDVDQAPVKRSKLNNGQAEAVSSFYLNLEV
jgi:hypothetical protein